MLEFLLGAKMTATAKNVHGQGAKQSLGGLALAPWRIEGGPAKYMATRADGEKYEDQKASST